MHGQVIDIKVEDGSTVTVINSSVPIWMNGRVYGAVSTFQDITERKKLEESLSRSNIELQNFAYVASHDLQEPLRMVTSYLGLLEKRYGGLLEDQAREYIDFAVDGSVRMKQLIEDLLLYSRVDTMGQELVSTNMEDV